MSTLTRNEDKRAPIHYGQILDFGSTPSGSGSGTGSDNRNSSHTNDEN